ncbi:MAG: hypothetical protein ACP5JT_04990 [Thermoplasmata archaeon]
MRCPEIIFLFRIFFILLPFFTRFFIFYVIAGVIIIYSSMHHPVFTIFYNFTSCPEIFLLVVLETDTSGLFCIVFEKLKGIFDEFESIDAITYIQDISEGILNAMIKYRNDKPTYEEKLQWYKYLEEHYDCETISKEL